MTLEAVLHLEAGVRGANCRLGGQGRAGDALGQPDRPAQDHHAQDMSVSTTWSARLNVGPLCAATATPPHHRVGTTPGRHAPRRLGTRPPLRIRSLSSLANYDRLSTGATPNLRVSTRHRSPTPLLANPPILKTEEPRPSLRRICPTRANSSQACAAGGATRVSFQYSIASTSNRSAQYTTAL